MHVNFYHFDRFVVDRRNRQLFFNEAVIPINAKYFDALLLLLERNGELVHKQQFFEEVWNEAEVSDESLSQCIRYIRKVLGDSASEPQYIATVPKYGYRFIAPVHVSQASELSSPDKGNFRQRKIQLADLGLAGTVGGAMAGLLGGMIYGFTAALQSSSYGLDRFSILLAIIVATVVIATVGAAAISFGIAGARAIQLPVFTGYILGGASGGFAVGAGVKLIGLDLFQLLLGNTPGDIAGGLEGVLLGSAIGLGAWIVRQETSLLFSSRKLWLAIAAGCTAGIIISLLDGRLMTGSLVSIAQQFPESSFALDPIGLIFPFWDISIGTSLIMGGFEGALFAGGILAAIVYFRRADF